jgi:Flp pilus assembly protein TadD
MLFADIKLDLDLKDKEKNGPRLQEAQSHVSKPDTLEQGIRELESLERDEPSAELPLFRAFALSQTARLDEAKQIVLAVLRKNDKSVLAHSLLGFFELREKNWSAADRELNKAVAIQPECWSPRRLLVEVSSLQGDADGEVARAGALLEAIPEPDNFTLLIELAAKAGKSALAVPYCRRALEKVPAQVGYRAFLVNALIRAGQLKDALEALDETEKKLTGPTPWAMWFDRARILAGLGRKEEARAALEKARAGAPEQFKPKIDEELSKL